VKDRGEENAGRSDIGIRDEDARVVRPLWSDNLVNDAERDVRMRVADMVGVLDQGRLLL
jgi:hypothetical protein